jgi:hypothetical protein
LNPDPLGPDGFIELFSPKVEDDTPWIFSQHWDSPGIGLDDSGVIRVSAT